MTGNNDVATSCHECQRCGLTKKLVKSHVIPDNMNRVLRSVLGDNANAPILTIDKGTGRTKRYPMGLYDKGILCKACDGTFSPWEEHAHQVFFTKHAWTSLLFDSRNRPYCYTLRGGDYKKLKLCILSIIWRASIRSSPFFRNVNLDTATNDAIKARLLVENPGSATEFTVRIAQYHSIDIPLAAFEPREQTIGGIHYVVLYLPGYKILVQVDQGPLPADHDAILVPGTPVIIRLLDYRTSPERRAVVKIGKKVAEA